MLRRMLLALFAGALVLGAGLETPRASSLGMAWLLYDDVGDAYNPIVPCPVGGDQGGGAAKQTICHNGNTIEVASSAVAAHLAHGDSAGACP